MSKCVKCGNEILTGDIHWEMGLCNNCYNELYKDHKTHISLDKMWLKLAQDFRDENEKLQDKVADLEAKLAESEKKAYSRGHSQRDIANEIKLNALREDVANKEKRIVELKQQLAEKEKEKEIEELKLKLDIRAISLQNFNIERMQAHQGKISFALEQLGKVKELLNTDFESTISWIDPYEDGEYLNSMTYNHNNTIKIIDNQIKQLKEMKERINGKHSKINQLWMLS